MSLLSNTNPTLADVAKRTDPDGSIPDIVEILNLTNPILTDLTAVACNDGSSHEENIRTGLPQPTWTKIYGRVQPTKSTTAPVTERCGMLEDYSNVDVRLFKKNGNSEQWRFTEDAAHLEGMNQEVARTIFYGNEGADPAKFTGLAPRYNTLDLAKAQTAENVISGGGAGVGNASLWIIDWSPKTIFGLYPQGSKAGLTHKNLGETTSETADGLMQVLRTHFSWDIGLCVRDWRYAVRIPNIKIADLTKDAATGADLADLLVQGLERMPGAGMGRRIIYGNRDVRTALRRQIANNKNVNLTVETVAGKRVEMFDGVPFHQSDALISNEQAVTM